jgi:hypothetical protein
MAYLPATRHELDPLLGQEDRRMGDVVLPFDLEWRAALIVRQREIEERMAQMLGVDHSDVRPLLGLEDE